MAELELCPHILARFQVEEAIGKGSYGCVYRVKDKKTGKVFALKKIIDAFQSDEDAQRTLREILILKAIGKHPHINTLKEVIPSENKGNVYLLLDYIATDLTSISHLGPLSIEHSITITYQLLCALRYIHSGGIVHRDLKPSNILLSFEGEVRL